MDALKSRIALREGLKKIGIKEDHIGYPAVLVEDEGYTFDQPNLDEVKYNFSIPYMGGGELIIYNTNGEFRMDVRDLIKAAYDNSSYGTNNMPHLEFGKYK